MRTQTEGKCMDYADETSSSEENVYNTREELPNLGEQKEAAEKEAAEKEAAEKEAAEKKREKNRERKKKRKEEREASSQSQAQTTAGGCQQLPGSGVPEPMMRTQTEGKCKDYPEENVYDNWEELAESLEQKEAAEKEAAEKEAAKKEAAEKKKEKKREKNRERKKKKKEEREASSQSQAQTTAGASSYAVDLPETPDHGQKQCQKERESPKDMEKVEEKLEDDPVETSSLAVNELKGLEDLNDSKEETLEAEENEREKKKNNTEEMEASSHTHGGEIRASSYAVDLPETPDHGQDQQLVTIDPEDPSGELYHENGKMKLKLGQAEEGEKLCQKERDSPEDIEKVNEKLEEFYKASSTCSLHTKAIEFLGHSRRIVLQDMNGPCSLIAICNYLILTDQMTLTEERVNLQGLLDNVFARVFPLLKNENHEAIWSALMQTTSGLDIDISFESFDRFAESIQYSIFKALKIPLYHAWVIDPKHPSTGEAAEAEFLNSTSQQITEYGLSQLQSSIDVKQLFVLFRNNHFCIIYKHQSKLYSLQTDDSFLTINRMWQRIDDVKGNGGFVSSSFFNPQLKIPRFDIPRVRHPQVKDGGDHVRTSFTRNKQKVPRAGISQPSSSLVQSSSSRTAPTPDQFKGQFAAMFMSKSDTELGCKFLEFLKEYKVNDVQYYKLIVKSMRDLASSEMRVFYDHIQEFDSEFAQRLCHCYPRLREHLNHAASSFIEYLKPELGFECKTPLVRVVELPQPDSWWLTLDDFLGKSGNHPSEVTSIYCGQCFLNIPETTAIGRIALTNLFSTLTKAFQRGQSWGGNWTISNVLINGKLKVQISAPYCEKTTRNTIMLDLVRCADDVLPRYEIDGQMPALFMHLDKTLRHFVSSRDYSTSMLQNFSTFITAHSALKSALVNLNFIDGIYSMHKYMSKNAKRLLQCILLSFVPLVDWTAKFIGNQLCQPCDDPVPPILRSVWNYWKDIMERNSNEGDDKAKECIPFENDGEGGLIFMRHVRHHRGEASKDKWGEQQLGNLSHLYLITCYFMGDMLPQIVECLTCDVDEHHEEFDQLAYEELLGWLNEQLELYNRPEFSDRYQSISWTS